MVFLHSLLRYAVLFALLYAVFTNLRGWLIGRPILTGERMITIVAMVLCHVQLLLGAILYGMNWNALKSRELDPFHKFVKYEHAGTMVLAVALITLGRVLSKRAQDERSKQRQIAVFYGIGTLLILWAVPWPFRDIGHSLGWL